VLWFSIGNQSAHGSRHAPPGFGTLGLVGEHVVRSF